MAIKYWLIWQLWGAESLGLMYGKIVGKSSDYIIDYWIVDFNESLTKDKAFVSYPFKVLSVLHTAFVI